MTMQCPDCDTEAVTLDPDEGTILGHPIEDFVFLAGDGDDIGITGFCWECGWETEKILSVEVKR